MILVWGTYAQNVVKITSNPSDAGVSIDGEYIGTTPITVLDTIGSHMIYWSLDGYQIYSNKYNILDKNETLINANLRIKEKTPNWSVTLKTETTVSNEKNIYMTNIISFPPGAKVYIDSIERGKTPLTIPSDPGMHIIWLDLNGYQVYSNEYLVNDNQNTTIRAHMRLETPTRKITPTKKPTPQVSHGNTIYNLTLISSPPGAEVYIDTKYYGTTPLIIPSIPGTHMIWWKLPEYQTYSRHYLIYDGKDTKIHVNLRLINSSLNINITEPQVENNETEGDISIASVISNTTLLRNVPFSIDFVIKNAGSSINGEFQIKILLSNDTKSSIDDLVLLNTSLDGLDENAFDLHTVNVTIPDNIPPGPYYIIVEANPDLTVDERNRFNNEGYELVIVRKEQNNSIPDNIKMIPNETAYPGDPDGDGYYEDLNGNGITDYHDVELFYQNFQWITQNEPVKYFDINGNGIIDYDDISLLFKFI